MGLLDAAYKFIWGDSRVGYDGVKDLGRRRSPKTRTYSVDTHLDKQYRDRAVATAQDAQRNFGLVAWMIRKHLDFVATFRFQARNDNKEFNTALERYMDDYSKPWNCDVRGRHSLRRIIRLAEATRSTSGDILLQKLTSASVRGRLQAIEPDLIRIPDMFEAGSELSSIFEEQQWVNGVRLDRYGRTRAYSICKRVESTSNYEFDRFLAPSRVFSLGYYERFDQVRGVSPLMSNLNTINDLYESFDMQFMKIKMQAAFGLFLFRDTNDALPGISATQDTNGDGIPDDGHTWDPGAGVFQMELNTEDRVEVKESAAPHYASQKYAETMMDIVAKSLDLPIGFIDESRSNFAGSRAGLVLYEKACEDKRRDLIELLNQITRWRLGLAVADGELQLPPGLQFDEIQWEWVPAGTPWYDPQKEVAGLKNAIGANLDNFERAARSRGTDFYENCDINAKAMQYATERGVPPILATTTSAQQVIDEEPEETNEPEAVTDED